MKNRKLILIAALIIVSLSAGMLFMSDRLEKSWGATGNRQSSLYTNSTGTGIRTDTNYPYELMTTELMSAKGMDIGLMKSLGFTDYTDEMTDIITPQQRADIAGEITRYIYGTEGMADNGIALKLMNNAENGGYTYLCETELTSGDYRKMNICLDARTGRIEKIYCSDVLRKPEFSHEDVLTQDSATEQFYSEIKILLELFGYNNEIKEFIYSTEGSVAIPQINALHSIIVTNADNEKFRFEYTKSRCELFYYNTERDTGIFVPKIIDGIGYSAGDDCYYYVKMDDGVDGDAHIRCISLSDATDRIFCDVKDCKHDSEKCPAVIKLAGRTAMPVWSNADTVMVMYSGFGLWGREDVHGENRFARIEFVSRNGEKKTMLLDDDNEQVIGMPAIKGDTMYIFTLKIIKTDGVTEYKYYFNRYNLQTGNRIRQEVNIKSPRIRGCADNFILISETVSGATKEHFEDYYYLNIDDFTLTPADNIGRYNAFVYFDGETVVSIDRTTKNLRAESIRTGAAADMGNLSGDFKADGIIGITDGILQYLENNNDKKYAEYPIKSYDLIHQSEMNVHISTYQDNQHLNNAPVIVARNDDRYLIVSRVDTAMVPRYTFAVISKADYNNSVSRNMITVTN